MCGGRESHFWHKEWKRDCIRTSQGQSPCARMGEEGNKCSGIIFQKSCDGPPLEISFIVSQTSQNDLSLFPKVESSSVTLLNPNLVLKRIKKYHLVVFSCWLSCLTNVRSTVCSMPVICISGQGSRVLLNEACTSFLSGWGEDAWVV